MPKTRQWLQQHEVELTEQATAEHTQRLTPDSSGISDTSNTPDKQSLSAFSDSNPPGPARWLFRFFCMLFLAFCAFMLADLGASLLGWWEKNPGLALFLGTLSMLALLCAVLWIYAEIKEISKIRELKESHAALETAIASQQSQAVRQVLLDIARPYAQYAALEARLQHTRDIPSMLAETEHMLFADADAKALVAIRRALRDLSISTALIPSPFFDALFMVGRGSMLLRDIARCYGLRPGLRGIWTLWYSLLSGAALVATLDLASETVQESLNESLPPALKGAGAFILPAGQALIAALRTSRLGLAAITLCRPLPFDKKQFPSTWELVRGIFPDLRKSRSEKE